MNLASDKKEYAGGKAGGDFLAYCSFIADIGPE
jgi:hypothetical protein